MHSTKKKEEVQIADVSEEYPKNSEFRESYPA
jgi:hypothetical protein